MLPIPPGRRPLLAAGLLALAVAAPAAAADPVIIIAREPMAPAATDPAKGAIIPNPNLRPNNRQAFYVFVKNATDEPKTYGVEIVSPDGAVLATTSKPFDLLKGATAQVQFEPAPPPAPAPKKDAEPAPKDPAPKTAPPAGVQLQPTKFAPSPDLKFGFYVRLLEGKKEVFKRPVPIDILRPTAYLDTPVVQFTGEDRRTVAAKVPARPARPADQDKKDPEKKETEKKVEPLPVGVSLDPPVEVVLTFPAQLGLRATELGAGSYRRTLSRPGQVVELQANDLPFTREADLIRFHLSADGFARAFTYTMAVGRNLGDANSENRVQADDLNKPVVRLYPVSTGRKAEVAAARVTTTPTDVPRYPTLPVKDLRFRIEVDNEPSDTTLELRIDRARNRKFLDPDETIHLGLPRDYKVFLEVTGKDGMLIASNTVEDHVAVVDVSALRGAHAFQALLRKPGARDEDCKKAEYELVVDETPPPADKVDVGGFPPRHLKGKPLQLTITADDPESRIDRVTVYLGKPGPDGKIPEGTPKVDASPVPFTKTWEAEVLLQTPPPPPPPAPGAPPVPKTPAVADLTAVAENGVGLTTTKVVRIELIDPPLGSIRATVLRGGRPQPGVEVFLLDADAKEKGTAKTGEKGKDSGVAVFPDLPPGTYHLFAGKPDASTGLVGSVRVQVKIPTTSPPKPEVAEVEMKKRR